MNSRNWTRNFLILLLLAAIVFSLVSCQQKKITSATESGLRFGIEIEPERLNPLTAKNPQTFIVLMQIFEGLLGSDRSAGLGKDEVKYLLGYSYARIRSNLSGSCSFRY